MFSLGLNEPARIPVLVFGHGEVLVVTIVAASTVIDLVLCVNDQADFPGEPGRDWGPLIVMLQDRLGTLIEHSKPVSSLITSPDARGGLASELFDTYVLEPLHVTTTDVPKRLSVHVTAPLLVKLRLAESDLPSAERVPVASTRGHLMFSPPPVRMVSVEMAVNLLPAGVEAAWAAGASARTASTATVSSRPLAGGFFMACAFLPAPAPRIR